MVSHQQERMNAPSDFTRWSMRHRAQFTSSAKVTDRFTSPLKRKALVSPFKRNSSMRHHNLAFPHRSPLSLIDLQA